MTKKEFADLIAAKSGLTKADSMRAYDAFLEVSSDLLKKGERIQFLGFGSFAVAERPARVARNPRTGKEIKVAAKKVVKFKAGKQLADAVASSKKKK